MFSTFIVAFTIGFVCGTLTMTAIASWIIGKRKPL